MKQYSAYREISTGRVRGPFAHTPQVSAYEEDPFVETALENSAFARCY